MSSITQSSLILTEKYYNMDVIDKLLSVNTTLPGYHAELMWNNDQNKLREIKKIRLTVVKQLSINLWITALVVYILFLIKIRVNQCLTSCVVLQLMAIYQALIW